jgi:uncharacterized membrane protein
MGRVKAGWNSALDLAVRQGKFTLLGLGVVLIPVVVVVKSIEHAHKLLTRAATTVAPGIEVVGGVGIGVLVLLFLFAACCFVGWLVSRTDRGQRLVDWEASKFLPRSPLEVQKEVKKVRTRGAGQAAPTPAKEVQPALARVGGGWQPGVIVKEQSGSWASVFLPDIPSVATGRLYMVHEDHLMRLDVPLDSFRKQLASSGHDSGDWLQALAKARPDGGGSDPGA